MDPYVPSDRQNIWIHEEGSETYKSGIGMKLEIEIKFWRSLIDRGMS